jgi:hypothetical protein
VSAAKAAAAHGSALTPDGDNAGAIALVDPRWNALVDVPGADEALLALGKVLCQAAARFGDPRRDVLDRRLQIAERIGAQEELADALTALALSYSMLGSPLTSRTVMSAAADLARTNHYPVALSRCLSNLTVEYNLIDLRRAVEVGREAVEVAGRAGIAIWMSFTDANLTLALMAAGEWAALDESLAQTGNLMVDQTVYGGVDGFLRVARGQRHELPWPADSPPDSDDPADQSWIAFAEAFEARSRGDLERALARAVVAVDVQYELSGSSDDLVHMWPPAVELAMALGKTGVRDRLLAIMDADEARRLVPVSLRAHRSRFAGLMARDTDPDAVEDSMRSAIAGFAEWGSRPYLARAEAELGRWLVGLGRESEGVALIDKGVAVLRELGAERWLAEVAGTRADAR